MSAATARRPGPPRAWRRAVTTLALCLSSAGAAHAAEPDELPPPAGSPADLGAVASPGPDAVPVAGAEHAPADAPDASAAAGPTWLRSSASRPASSDEPRSGSASLAWLFVPSLALGAVALWLALRRKGAAGRALGGHRLAVLASTRVGPRAHAVVVDAGGRPLLLGVTDSGVTVLARLPRPAAAPAVTPAQATPKPVSTESAASFNQLLADLGIGSRATRRPATEPVAAAEIARTVRDEYVGRREARGETEPDEPLEGQIAGLAARLAGRRA